MLLSLIVWLVALGLVWWLVDTHLPLPAPIKTVIQVLFVLALIYVVLSVFGILPGGHVPQLKFPGLL